MTHYRAVELAKSLREQGYVVEVKEKAWGGPVRPGVIEQMYTDYTVIVTDDVGVRA